MRKKIKKQQIVLKPYGMSKKDLEYYKGKMNKSSSSSYRRLISLYILFDVNMEYLYKCYAKKLDIDASLLKKNLCNDMPSHDTNCNSIDTWYERLIEYLKKNDNFACNKCLLDAMHKGKDIIIEEEKTEDAAVENAKKEAEDSKKKAKDKKEKKTIEKRLMKEEKKIKNKIAKDYDKYMEFLMKFYVSAFDSLKSEGNECYQNFNKCFQSYQSDWEKFLIMHTILPLYGIEVPTKKSDKSDEPDKILNDIFKKYSDPLNVFFKKEILEKFCSDEGFRKILSSFRENWGMISEIFQNKFLASKLLDLISHEETLLEELKKLEKYDPSLNYNNVVKYAFLLNYRIKANDRVKPDAILNSFSDYYESEKETVFFCCEIALKLLPSTDFTERLIRCFKLLFYYACIEQ